jgi:hypothetical protein
MISTTLTSLVDDEDDFDLDPRDCAGNSHLLIECQYTAISARCACGSTVKRLANGRWVHPDGRVACPPYECGCGQRHNVRAS